MTAWQREKIIGDARLLLGDCREILPTLGKVDAVVADPPYFKVKGEAWDRQWDKPAAFLDWLGGCLGLMADCLAFNGSLYLFASPQMAARVEVKVAERFNILNHIVWRKGAAARSVMGWSQKTAKEDLRAYLPTTERIIFAEHYGADNRALGESGYEAECDKLRGFVFEPLRKYLDDERRRAGVDKADCNVACGFSHSAGGMASRHYFSRSQWCLPTREHYEAMRRLFNAKPGEHLRREYEDLRREYEDLRREYEDLRREYEDLRREYEDLRRPFGLSKSDPWSDVWDFDPLMPGKGEHVCQKPLALMEHIIKTSTREGALVCDPFAGSGSTGVACVRLGRRFVGIEQDHRNFDIACRRMEAATHQGDMFVEPPKPKAEQLELAS